MLSIMRTTGFDAATIEGFTRDGSWGTRTFSDLVTDLAAGPGADRPAFLGDGGTLTWSEYDAAASRMAARLIALGLPAGGGVAVLLPDLPVTHVAYLALERAGLVVVGIGPRSGRQEIVHLLRASGACALLTLPVHRDVTQSELFAELAALLPDLTGHLMVSEADPGELRATGTFAPARGSARRSAPAALGPNDVFLVNSTSGTTGLPKCVQHTQNRWLRFVRHAIDGGALTPADVVLSALPTPYGFGLWTTHFLPAVLGVPLVLMRRWDRDHALHLMREHGVTVFAGVTTQMLMVLDALDAGAEPPPALRVVYTGGEAVPFERARAFERRTGALVLQFYGSNESGALSCTTVHDTEDQRLRTAGRVLPEMAVELVDPATGATVTGAGERGQPVCYGPLMSPGYLGDPAANDQLFDAHGRMRMADLATISADGYLTVVGRVADIIIRGGANISAGEVEADISSHPAVALAAVVGMPDPTFGERVCAFVQLVDGGRLDLDTLRAHLRERGVSPQCWPERLEIVATMPRNAGEKIAKDDLRRRVAAG